MKKKEGRCPVCREPLKKVGRKKICPHCGVEVVGDTFRFPPLQNLGEAQN